MYATLIDQGKSKQELEQLDDVWLYFLYWHPRDEQGNILISAKPQREEEQKPVGLAWWLAWCRDRGAPDWYAHERWEEEQERQAQDKARAAQRKAAAQQAATKKARRF